MPLLNVLLPINRIPDEEDNNVVAPDIFQVNDLMAQLSEYSGLAMVNIFEHPLLLFAVLLAGQVMVGGVLSLKMVMDCSAVSPQLPVANE